MKRTNLNIFYSLGKNLATIDKIEAGMKPGTFVLDLIQPRMWLFDFLEQTKEMSLPETRKAAKILYSFINSLLQGSKDNWDKAITEDEVRELSGAFSSFEKHFEEEHKQIAVFTVIQKAIYDMSLLMNTPELKFPEKIRTILPEQMIYDLKQAAQCLAFEIPTACAFHVCRGTEAVMLAYYEHLAKHPWSLPRRNWNTYIQHLAKEKAPKQITERLNEIRALDRNSYIHPDINVSLEEAPILFELCTGVVFLMGQEMV